MEVEAETPETCITSFLAEFTMFFITSFFFIEVEEGATHFVEVFIDEEGALHFASSSIREIVFWLALIELVFASDWRSFLDIVERNSFV
jgi:hypothetical protein